MPLTDISIRNAKPKDKPYKLTDGRGLYLLVKKTGKYFRWDYRFGGKRKTYSFGVYPDVKLGHALVISALSHLSHDLGLWLWTAVEHCVKVFAKGLPVREGSCC